MIPALLLIFPDLRPRGTLRFRASPSPTITLMAIESGDLMNSEAGFLKPEDKVQPYDRLFTNEYLR